MSNFLAALRGATLAVLLGAAFGAANAQPQQREPISFIGHGALFDADGREVAPTAGFLRQALAWYRADLLRRVPQDTQASFTRLERELNANLPADSQARMLVTASLLGQLAESAGGDDSGRLRGKLNLIRTLLQGELPREAAPTTPRPIGRFELPDTLRRQLEAALTRLGGGGTVVPFSLTASGGAAYRTECANAGVPIPPDMGDPRWISRGVIPRTELFIARGMDAEVLTYESAAPIGMCIALPRFDRSNTVKADGVICVGKVSSKVCFWDNEKNGNVFTFTRGTARPFSDFGGGTELVGTVGGVCSNCHAGENPFVIHGDVLGSLAGILPTFPNNWYDPIVRTGDTVPWPENPGPMNAPGACVGCHVQGSAGRLPHLSNGLKDYCDSVLRPSIGALPVATRPPPSMPPGSPGSLAPGGVPTPTMQALLDWCGVAPSSDAASRGDPHVTTFGGVNYDFQAAGEFVYLRDAAGLEIQARHTPVPTAARPPANLHTGLSSCVSVNTAIAARIGKARVTLQPSGGAPGEFGPPELKVDGKPVRLGKRPIDLGDGARLATTRTGDGLEATFPDGTRLIVVPAFWDAQNLWYFNVEVLKSQAREGVLGALTAGQWLPLLPDGTPLGPRPAALAQRHVDLNQKFADAWRVTSATSLFDYTPGTSTATFTDPSWPPPSGPCNVGATGRPAAAPIAPQRAKSICADIKDTTLQQQCIFDVSATGDPGFAKTYRLSEQLRGP
jgi:hypothetical protein